MKNYEKYHAATVKSFAIIFVFHCVMSRCDFDPPTPRRVDELQRKLFEVELEGQAISKQVSALVDTVRLLKEVWKSEWEGVDIITRVGEELYECYQSVTFCAEISFFCDFLLLRQFCSIITELHSGLATFRVNVTFSKLDGGLRFFFFFKVTILVLVSIYTNFFNLCKFIQ